MSEQTGRYSVSTQQNRALHPEFPDKYTELVMISYIHEDEKPPTHANLSRFPSPKLRDCPPPIERPAIARLSLSVVPQHIKSSWQS